MSKIVTKSIDNRKQFKYHVVALKECQGELVPLLRQEINVPYRPKTIRFVKRITSQGCHFVFKKRINKMKKFNKSKVIIPALAMIALTTAASATGTVAWFTANNTVTASTLTFKAKANTNLYIAAGATAEIGALVNTSATLNITTGAIQPVTLEYAKSKCAVKIPATWTEAPKVDDKGTANTYTTVANITETEATAESTYTVSDYICVGYVTIGRKLAESNAIYDLTPTVKISFAAASALNKCVRAGIVMNGTLYQSGDYGVETATNDVSFTFTSEIENLTDNVAYHAALMVWYEGTDSDCIANNAITLSTNTASWEFTSKNHD